ncbi:hypothetical protein K474DRAFT_1668126 [Panus rudis PR-1116 ss-1]|nr:hypothetical protein K474DRAFT_1668126 [Panus rudis PR-1116 ss-1]
MAILRTLSNNTRLAALVDALSLYVSEDVSDSEDQCGAAPPTPDGYWDLVSLALKQTSRLQFFDIHIDNGDEMSNAWVLRDATFQLRTFHCDFSWDEHLVTFLDSQASLSDLYILDFQIDTGGHDITRYSNNPAFLPSLSVLECTFMEAAAALVPGHAISRLKTCFTHSEVEEKRLEMRQLLTHVRRTRRHLRALDIADSSYDSAFTVEFAQQLTNALTHSTRLKYLGTLALPIDGRERLEFYGLLMRLPGLQCVELEVSDWEPAPTRTVAALRSLTFELRLYCPSISRVVFVYDLDRYVMKVVDHSCVVDQDVNPELLWREI